MEILPGGWRRGAKVARLSLGCIDMLEKHVLSSVKVDVGIVVEGFGSGIGIDFGMGRSAYCTM